MMHRDELRRKQKRAFTGLAGSPFARVEQPAEPAATPAPAEPKRRGRPRKHADAAAKQKAHRDWKRWQQVIEENRDNKGRLHDETSGGYGMKKIEQVVAAVDRKERYGGQKPVIGHGPASFEHDVTADEADTDNSSEVRPENSRRRAALNWNLTEREKELEVEELTEELFEGEEALLAPEFGPNSELVQTPGTLRCELCHVVVDYWRDAVRHLVGNHPEVVEERLREAAPKRAQSKRARCSASMHSLFAERMRQRKEQGRVRCKRCNKLVYDSPNFVTRQEKQCISLTQHGLGAILDASGVCIERHSLSSRRSSPLL